MPGALTAAIVAELVTASGWLIAQSVSNHPEAMNIGTLIANLGIVGVLVWHMWYHTTKSYPTMMEKFAMEIEKIRSAFLKEQRESRESSEHEMAELRRMLIQALQGMRTAVHDVRDTANAAISKQAAKAIEGNHGKSD